MRKCPYPGCGKRIDPVFFMCPLHWRSLTPDQQNRVSKAYQDYRLVYGNRDYTAAAGLEALERLTAVQQKVLSEVANG